MDPSFILCNYSVWFSWHIAESAFEQLTCPYSWKGMSYMRVHQVSHMQMAMKEFVYRPDANLAILV